MNGRKAVKRISRVRQQPAPFAYSGLERIFHERGRLAVCSCLVAHPEGLSFTELQEACGLTDGNLSRHLYALADVDILAISKHAGSGGRMLTICRITPTGRARFLGYIDELESVVRDVHACSDEVPPDSDSRVLTRLATT
ncbi:MAG: transcriptional regulator [Candidatus Eremiobacteraeota bacterium]|nr:transcriptional regulator [Candidatus Eremiobacteraeota bacterium]